MDPFVLPLSHFEYKINPQVYGSLSIKNSKTYGMSQGKINSVKTKIDENTLEAQIDVSYPKIFLQGLYKGEVSFNDIKMLPKGSFNVTISINCYIYYTNKNITYLILFLEDIDAVFKIKGKFTKRNNEKYMLITSFDVDPQVSEMNIKVTGILPDEGLSEYKFHRDGTRNSDCLNYPVSFYF